MTDVLKTGSVGEAILKFAEAQGDSPIGHYMIDCITLGQLMIFADALVDEDLKAKVKDFLDKEILAIRDKKL